MQMRTTEQPRPPRFSPTPTVLSETLSNMGGYESSRLLFYSFQEVQTSGRGPGLWPVEGGFQVLVQSQGED